MNDLIYRIKRNPVLIAAFLLALEAVVNGAPWRAGLSIALGIITRHFVAPEFEVQEDVRDALEAGIDLGYQGFRSNPLDGGQ